MASLDDYSSVFLQVLQGRLWVGEQSEGDNLALTMGLMHLGIILDGTELLLFRVTTICPCLCGIGERWAETCCTQTPGLRMRVCIQDKCQLQRNMINNA